MRRWAKVRRDKHKNKDKDEGAPAWMVTYGDMMTLLLCFFVLLFSFSSIDAAKFKEVLSALQAKLGVLEGGKTISQGPMITSGMQNNNISAYYYDRKEFNKLMNKLNDYIDESNLESNVKLSEEERGLVIRFTGKILFDLGKAEIKSEGKKTLNKVADFLQQIPNDLMIEGHTDNIPVTINKKYDDNWVLSAFRAINVHSYLMENTDIKAKRLSLAAYGEHKPIKPNNSPENRALNRRVDIVVLRTWIQKEGKVGGGLNE